MSKLELREKIKELKELKIMMDELKGEIEGIEDIIKSEMAAQDTEQLIVGEYKIRWTTVKSNRFDSTSFRKIHTDLYTEFLKESVSRRFSIA